MKAQVISSNHTVIIDENQIDLWYNFERSWMQIFVNGEEQVGYHFSPSFKSFNYVNILEVATTILKRYRVRKESENRELEISQGIRDS